MVDVSCHPEISEKKKYGNSEEICREMAENHCLEQTC